MESLLESLNKELEFCTEEENKHYKKYEAWINKAQDFFKSDKNPLEELFSNESNCVELLTKLHRKLQNPFQKSKEMILSIDSLSQMVQKFQTIQQYIQSVGNLQDCVQQIENNLQSLETLPTAVQQVAHFKKAFELNPMISEADKPLLVVMQQLEIELHDKIKAIYKEGFESRKHSQVLKAVLYLKELQKSREAMELSSNYIIHVLELSLISASTPTQKKTASIPEKLNKILAALADTVEIFQETIEKYFDAYFFLSVFHQLVNTTNKTIQRLIEDYIKENSSTLHLSFDPTKLSSLAPTTLINQASPKASIYLPLPLSPSQIIDTLSSIPIVLALLNKYLLYCQHLFSSSVSYFSITFLDQYTNDALSPLALDEKRNKFISLDTYCHITGRKQVLEDHQRGDYLFIPKDNLLPKTASIDKLKTKLVDLWIPSERYVLLNNVLSAFYDQDEVDWEDSESFTSTAVDECFYVLKHLFQRAVLSNDIHILGAIGNAVSFVFDTQIIPILEFNVTQSATLFNQFFQSPSIERIESFTPKASVMHLDNYETCNSMYSFVHSMNNYALCGEHLSSLLAYVEEEFISQFLHDNREEYENPSADNPLKGSIKLFQLNIQTLQASKKTLQEELKKNSKKILSIFIPSIQRAIVYLQEQSYTLSSEEYDVLQGEEEAALTPLLLVLSHLKGFLKRLFLPEIHKEVFGLLCERLVDRLNRLIYSKKFSLFGAILLDIQIKRVQNFFLRETEIMYRPFFANLNAMVTVLQCENEEELSLIGTADIPSPLTPQEIEKVFKLRMDIELSH